MYKIIFSLSVLLLFSCGEVEKIDTSSWLLKRTKYFSFWHPPGMKLNHVRFGRVEDGLIKGEITLPRFTINFVLLRDKDHVSPCTGYTDLPQGKCETQWSDSIPSKLCTFNRNNKLTMHLCINNENVFKIKDVSENDTALLKEIFFGIRMN